jgi:hypothetical protein
MEESDREHVHEPAQKSFEPVLAAAEPSRMMNDLDFGRPKTADLAQGGNHAVHLAVERQLLDDVRAVALEAAVVIMQPRAGHGAQHRVEDAAWNHLVPGVVPHSFPTAHDVEAFLEFGKEPPDLLWIVL